MASLKELLLLSNHIEQLLLENDGEITTEIEEQMKISDAQMADKIDGYALVIAKIDRSIEHHNSLLKDHAAHITRLERTKDSLMGALQNALTTLGVEFLKGNEFLIKTKSNPPKVDVLDEAMVPAEYKNEKVTVSVDKKKISEGLKIGVEIPGTRLVQTQRIDIKTRSGFVEDVKEKNKLIFG